MTQGAQPRRRGEPLSIWTVYTQPQDHSFVARQSVRQRDGSITQDAIMHADAIEPLREALGLDFGLARHPRREDDDPAIVETWSEASYRLRKTEGTPTAKLEGE